MNAALTRRWLCCLLLAAHAGPLSAGERKARTDVLGDPLPDGAVARLGSIRLRHADHIVFVAVLPGGKSVLAAGGQDRTVRVWDLASGKELRRFTHRETDDPARPSAEDPNRP